jgi:Leucine-rich repeat (LRR) protein
MITDYFNILPQNTLEKSNLGTISIPEEVFEHSKLEKLDLSYNNIEELEERVGDLKYLKYLDLSNNKLEKLPNSFAKLQELEILTLSNNQCHLFPEVLLHLKKLRILKLKGNQMDEIPASIGELSQLERLDLSFNPIKELPIELRRLHNLKDLICVSNNFASFPEVLLEMEQLEQLGNLDLDFRLKLATQPLTLFYKVLRQLTKQKASLETKKAAFDVFLGGSYEGSQETIIPLLSINYVEFAQVVRAYLINNYTKPIQANSSIAVLGKTAWINLELLSTNLEITKNVETTTTHVVLGMKIKKQQLVSFSSGLVFLSEKMLLAHIFPKQPANWMEDHRGQLLDLLLSEQNENISLALQLAKDNKLLDEMLTELLIAYTYVSPGNTDLRNEIKEIFYLRIPNFEQLTLPSSTFSFYTATKSEQAICQGIKNVTEQSEKWDGLKLANYLFQKHQVAYTYIMGYSTIGQEKEWLNQFLVGDTISFGALDKLKELPKSLNLFSDLRVLNLEGCAFRKFPNVKLLGQLPNLQKIDFRNNPISFIPRALFAELSPYKILLTKNKKK